jgi:hypothetical protein
MGRDFRRPAQDQTTTYQEQTPGIYAPWRATFARLILSRYLLYRVGKENARSVISAPNREISLADPKSPLAFHYLGFGEGHARQIDRVEKYIEQSVSRPRSLILAHRL